MLVSCWLFQQLDRDDEAVLSDSEADYDDSPDERAVKRLFSPKHRLRRVYSNVMLLLLLVFVFYMPFRVAFHPRDRCVCFQLPLLLSSNERVLRTSSCARHLMLGEK